MYYIIIIKCMSQLYVIDHNYILHYIIMCYVKCIIDELLVCQPLKSDSEHETILQGFEDYFSKLSVPM